jgi:hypothetical protein
VGGPARGIKLGPETETRVSLCSHDNSIHIIMLNTYISNGYDQRAHHLYYAYVFMCTVLRALRSVEKGSASTERILMVKNNDFYVF